MAAAQHGGYAEHSGPRGFGDAFYFLISEAIHVLH
jgi:hypothetical protein